MPVAVDLLIFVAGAAFSLGASYLLVTRLERIGERIGLSEALLGVVAALAGDAPEITSAVTALAMHQNKVGAGVVIGSNVFNLAALLGLGAVVAGSIALHRNVVLLGGVIGIWVAAVCLVTVLGLIPVAAGLIAALAALVPYILVLAAGGERLRRFALTRRWESWLALAVSEEEEELSEVIHPRHGRGRDAKHDAQQQRAERHRRAARARHDHGPRAAVNPVESHRRVVPGAHRHRARVRLPRQRCPAGLRRAHHRCVSRLRRMPADRGPLGRAQPVADRGSAGGGRRL